MYPTGSVSLENSDYINRVKKKKKKVGERDKTIPKKEKYTLRAKRLKKES